MTVKRTSWEYMYIFSYEDLTENGKEKMYEEIDISKVCFTYTASTPAASKIDRAFSVRCFGDMK